MEVKISVIIPAFNAEKYLRRSVESVLNQTYKNIEVVIVNDGSKDNTGEIANYYKDNYENVVVISTENRGVSSARNKGLDIATGELISFLDADDYLIPETLEVLYNDLIKNRADVACCAMGEKAEIYKKGCEVWEGKTSFIKTLEDNPYTYSSCGKLFKKEIVSDIRFVEGKKIHEDSYFIFCCFSKNPKVTVREDLLYVYTVNSESASHTVFSEKFFDILYFAEEKRKFVKDNFPEFVPLAKNSYLKAHISMLECFLRAPKKQFKNEIRNCIKAVKENKKYFIPSYPGDKRRFNIIVYNLYYIYRKIYRLKFKIK